jgi:hypothetical protein
LPIPLVPDRPTSTDDAADRTASTAGRSGAGAPDVGSHKCWNTPWCLHVSVVVCRRASALPDRAPDAGDRSTTTAGHFAGAQPNRSCVLVKMMCSARQRRRIVHHQFISCQVGPRPPPTPPTARQVRQAVEEEVPCMRISALSQLFHLSRAPSPNKSYSPRL